MSRRMEPKSKEELALDQKLAIGNTMIDLNHRLRKMEEKNELGAAIKQAHIEEVNSGSVSVPRVISIGDLTKWLTGSTALSSGESTESND